MEWGPVLAALAGGVTGGAIALATNSLGWRRATAERWDPARREAYERFLGCALRVHRWWSMRLRSDSKEELLRMGPAALDEIMEAVAGVNIIASGPVKEAADVLLARLAELVLVASQRRADHTHGTWSAYDDEALAELLDSFVKARAAFERAAHDELGVH